MSIIKRLPSMIKIDTQQIFELCEDYWGSKNLLALVVYGSAVKEPFFTEPCVKQFLGFKWRSTREIRNIPNDVDIAAIYSKLDNIEKSEHTEEEAARIMDYHRDEYSSWWQDTQRHTNLHLMCIEYDTLIANKNTDANLRKVLDDGHIIWGGLHRPMRRL